MDDPPTVKDLLITVAVLGGIVGLFTWLDNRAFDREEKRKKRDETLMKKKPWWN
jgi:hypothetical protein